MTSIAGGDECAGPRMLQVKNLSVGFGKLRVLEGVSFDVPAGDTLVVVGESGCGKTTLLKALAGLLPLREGEIWLDSRNITGESPAERRIVYLDQEPLLFEHLTVRENIGFAMRLKKRPSHEIAAAVDNMLESMDLGGHADKREWQLSGGQKQRVAFARAILAQSPLLLLDEPFCSLDSKTRGQMQAFFHDISKQFGLTSVFVTHDVKEALVVGNRFARMAGGVLSTYPDRQAFISDPATGIPDEIAFWKQSAGEVE